MPSDEQNLAPAQSPSLTELLTLVNSLKHQLDTQKTEMTQQISQLQTELAQVRQQPASTTATVASTPRFQPTSRRRMLGKVFTGFAGAAALAAGGAALTAAPAAQADAFNFNGGNTATVTTTITEPSSTGGAFPIFTFVNNNTAAATAPAGDPTQQPIGIYVQASNYAGVYSVGNTNASGVIGVSGLPATASAFNANNFGGVVGSSVSNGGVVGISTNGYGVSGLSAGSYGVAGVSQSATGGIFAVDGATDFYQGAALRIVPRQPIGAESGSGPANGVTPAYNHRQGEFHLDKFARVYVCNAAYLGGTGSNEPAAAKPRVPNFPDGPVSTADSSWQLLAPMVVRSSSPAAAFGTTPPSDYALHSVGEFWLDKGSNKLYICTTAGAAGLNTGEPNHDFNTKLGLTSLPTFTPVLTSGGFNFYPNLANYKTRIIAAVSTTGALPVNQNQPYNIYTVISTYPIPNPNKQRLPSPPAGISAIFGVLVIYAVNPPTAPAFSGEFLVSAPGSTAISGTTVTGSTVIAGSKGADKTSSFVVLPVDSSGNFAFAAQVGSLNVTFDMFGYIY